MPSFTIDEYNEIKEQKPIFSYSQGIKRSRNSIYVTEIFSSENLALESSYSRNLDIVDKRDEKFRKLRESPNNKDSKGRQLVYENKDNNQ